MGRHLALAACAVVLALAPGRSDAAQTYTVKKGDTLHRIARTLHVDVEALKRANGLDSSAIQPGAKLKVPNQDAKKQAHSESGELAARTKADPGAGARSDERAAGQDPAPRESTQRLTHVVKKGETLSAISRAFDVPVQDLQRLNAIGKKSKIQPGMTLVVKPGEPAAKVAKSGASRRVAAKTYVVRKGDNASRVARRFNLSVADLKSMNGLKSDSLQVGRKLLVGGEAVARRKGSSDDPVAECRLDDAQIHDELKELTSQAEQMGTEVGVTDQVLSVAKKMLGIRYKFGGSSFRGIDCSAYVQKVFRFLNVPLPRTAREQYAVGKQVDKGELATGDLVFFRTYARYPSHVGIYLGDNKFIHASSVNKKVTIDNLDAPFYEKRFIGAKRLVEEGVEEKDFEESASGEESAG